MLGEKLTTYPITNVFPLPLLEVLDKSAHNEALIDTNSPVIVHHLFASVSKPIPKPKAAVKMVPTLN